MSNSKRDRSAPQDPRLIERASRIEPMTRQPAPESERVVPQQIAWYLREYDDGMVTVYSFMSIRPGDPVHHLGIDNAMAPIWSLSADHIREYCTALGMVEVVPETAEHDPAAAPVVRFGGTKPRVAPEGWPTE